MNLGNIGALVMHRSERIAAGGFKIINGPSKKDKGPMVNEEDQELSNKASLPKPTQAGRIETCTELIEQARRCLESNNKQCVMRLIEELVRADCHNGHTVGKEVADKVKDVVHEVWLVSDNEHRCELLSMLRSLGMSKNWVREALGMNTKNLNKRLVKCGIDWESKVTRNDIVKVIESLLRERFGWSEARMCEEMWKFVSIDVDTFRRYGIEPCAWLSGLELLSDLRRPYWLGLARSDLAIRELDDIIRLKLDTTNAIDAVFFLTLLDVIRMLSLVITWKKKAPAAKYVRKAIALSFRVDLSPNEWPWPIKLSVNELEKILNSLSDEGLAMFIAGLLDGDGTVRYEFKNDYVAVLISACKDCPKMVILDVLKIVIAERFGIIGSIKSQRTANVLEFGGEKAVRLLRRIIKYMHHPLRRLRAELLLALYDGRISREAFEKLYEMTEYEYGGPDIKRNHGLEALARVAPQTHTHGGQR
jgi:hypothetical protein